VLTEHPYLYCSHNPVSSVDPTGHFGAAAAMVPTLIGIGPEGWIVLGVVLVIGLVVVGGLWAWNTWQRNRPTPTPLPPGPPPGGNPKPGGPPKPWITDDWPTSVQPEKQPWELHPSGPFGNPFDPNYKPPLDHDEIPPGAPGHGA
jgi:hypothetical protein